MEKWLLACVAVLAVSNAITLFAMPRQCDLEADMCIDADEWALASLQQIGAQEDADELARQLNVCERRVDRYAAIEASRERTTP